ncbi:SsgA family sporulation/cell division regulator [Streptomyces sp. NPDC002755]|uniref:SsgA family sporulation/cell division regulator n=1 Tax=Streptomyces sp. NPDC002884 TaxID=3154544 RepID=UPI003327FA7B
MTVHVSIPDELPVPLPAELRYDTSDPYAVCLSLGAPVARPVDWVFSRALLTEGLRTPSGIGDVMVIPRHGGGLRTVRIVLRSNAGAALIEIATRPVAAFLRKTVSLVSPGTESRHIDMDRALTELTGSRD